MLNVSYGKSCQRLRNVWLFTDRVWPDSSQLTVTVINRFTAFATSGSFIISTLRVKMVTPRETVCEVEHPLVNVQVEGTLRSGVVNVKQVIAKTLGKVLTLNPLRSRKTLNCSSDCWTSFVAWLLLRADLELFCVIRLVVIKEIAKITAIPTLTTTSISDWPSKNAFFNLNLNTISVNFRLFHKMA